MNSRIHNSITLATAVVCLLTGPLVADEAGPRIVRLEITPPTIQLDGFHPRQQILVTAVDSRGRRLDVTRRARIEFGDSSIAASDGSVIRGAANGRTTARITVESQSVEVAVEVAGLDREPDVHFRNDIIPLFSKLGCNSGGCHGKASGQNGFKLSVFGFDPNADYSALVKEARGRRLFPGNPAGSLLIQKAVGTVAHGGGRRTDVESPDYELMSRWIRQGMPWGDDQAAHLESIRIEPAERVLGPTSEQQLQVTAVFSDGKTRDVTDAAAYTSNSPAIADVTPESVIQTGSLAGEAAITINYMGQVGVARVVVPRGGSNSLPELPVHNPIDGFVRAKLHRMGIAPSALCDDATFLRRAYLDVIGTLPASEEVRAFLADDRTDKRERLIDALLDRPEYADYWSLKWADVLLVDRESLGERGAFEFHQWLRRQMSANRPYDEWVRELVTATGNSGKYGPVNFYRAARTPEDLTRAISQALLGLRLDCAQCHHHPFDRWGQEDFYGLAGYFSGIERQTLNGDRELVFHKGLKPARLPITGELVPVKPPGGDAASGTTGGDPRVQLAAWTTSPANPWFARLFANRLWKQMFGRGLVEPVDDLRSTNPATNEPLLEWLTAQARENGFDQKAMLRLIMKSRVYQLSSESTGGNHDDEQNFSHYMRKRLTAHVLLDAICQVTGVPEQFPGMPAGTRAIQVWDNRYPSYFLDTFGRSERQSPCECGRSDEPTMSQALHLMNAPEIESKITSASGQVVTMLTDGLDRDQIVAELCLATLSRPPGDREQRIAARLFESSPPRQAAEDYLWTLLNSYDFLFVK